MTIEEKAKDYAGYDIIMTIEEKAKDYAGYNILHSSDIITSMQMAKTRDNFKAGAEWMIDKAAAWFRNQKEEIGISWSDDYENRFRKAMEE